MLAESPASQWELSQPVIRGHVPGTKQSGPWMSQPGVRLHPLGAGTVCTYPQVGGEPGADSPCPGEESRPGVGHLEAPPKSLRNLLGFCTSGHKASASIQARGLPPMSKTQAQPARLNMLAWRRPRGRRLWGSDPCVLRTPGRSADAPRVVQPITGKPRDALPSLLL